VDLQKVTMPLLNIYAQFDHLVPPGAAEKLTSAVGSTDTEDLCLDTGHIGIYVSSKTQKEFAPKIIQWLKDHDGRLDPEHQVRPGRKKSARGRTNSTLKKKPFSIKRIEEMSHAGKTKLFFDDLQGEQGLRDNP
jgi:polyhydroxyalkanoate synthase subunit PhaC